MGRAARVGLALRRARVLEARERWSRDALESHQRAALARLVRFVAERSPFYRAHWGGVPGPDVTLDELRPVRRAALMAELDAAVTDPRLTRAALDAHLGTLAATRAVDPTLPGGFRVMASSGSTGEPARFVYEPDAWVTFLASCLRWTRWMGVTPRWPRLRTALIGAPDARHMTHRAAASLDVGVFATLRLSATDGVDRWCAALAAHRPDFVNMYPSVLALLLEAHRAGRLALRPQALCTSSELRSPELTAAARAAFGVTPFDCYATTETGIVAVDCAEHDGLHVFEDLTCVEIVDEAGRPAPPGTVGARVLLTNLYMTALPMIRVEVTDLLVEAPGRCACGLPFRRLRAVEGRADDLLTLRGLDGAPRRVHPIHLRSKLGACAEVVQYRVTLDDDGFWVEAVPRGGTTGDGVSRAVEAAVEAFLRAEGLAPRPVAVRVVDAVPREASAKLRVVRQLDGPRRA